MTGAEKKELVSFLKRGDKKKICELAGVHETVMYAWLSGRLKTSSIEPYVIQIVNERKREFAQRTGQQADDHFAHSEILVRENLQLKTELKIKLQESRKLTKLISSQNRIRKELFSALYQYIESLELDAGHKTKIIEKLNQFQSDFSFLNHYEKYVDVLSTINPLLVKSLEAIHSDISDTEKQLLSMLKLNLSSREIALIQAVSEELIKEKQKQLKIKFNLGPEESLPDFVNAIA